MDRKKRSLRDLSGIFGGMTGGAAASIRNRGNRIDAAVAKATGKKKPKKKKKGMW